MPISKSVSLQYTHMAAFRFDEFRCKNTISMREAQTPLRQRFAGLQPEFCRSACFEQSHSLSPFGRRAAFPWPLSPPLQRCRWARGTPRRGAERTPPEVGGRREHHLRDVIFGACRGPGYWECCQGGGLQGGRARPESGPTRGQMRKAGRDVGLATSESFGGVKRAELSFPALFL